VVTTVIVILSAAMILGIQSQIFHTVLAQSAKSNATTPTTNTFVTVTQANQLTRPSG
jgi:hypothetical protein